MERPGEIKMQIAKIKMAESRRAGMTSSFLIFEI
jgi:hypothetical protein